MNRLLTTNQISQIIGFDVRTVRKWCDEGNVFPTARKIPNTVNGQWRVLSDDVALLSMIDGQGANASMLADTNQQLATLKAENQTLTERVSWLENEYNKLANIYNTLLNEARDLDQTIANQQAEINDLQRYKDHYLQQQQKRRSQPGQQQKRRAA